MKKAWKYILISLLAIILIAGGTIYYFLNMKTYKVADEEVEEITESEYQIELPKLDTPSPSTSSDTPTEDEKTSEGAAEDTTGEGTTNEDSKSTTSSNNSKNTGSTTTNNNKPNSTSNNNSTETPTELTVATIKDTYRPVFESLEAQANAKIDSLVSRAIGEYRSKKDSGESISFGYFYQKYTSAGRALEGKTDETFNFIYSSLQSDLRKYGYSPNHAQEFKEQYENAKSARESALLNKAKEAL
jgi:ABC-type cobalt transport system substrate-binding protein